MNEAMVRDEHRRTESIVQGVAASSGQYAGRARVVFGDSFDDVEAGAVLVCRRLPASPSLIWRVGALVLDTGGALASAAIVAREGCIPAVVGTRTGTELISDGDYVVVDGTRGIVTILPRTQHAGPEQGVDQAA